MQRKSAFYDNSKLCLTLFKFLFCARPPQRTPPQPPLMKIENCWRQLLKFDHQNTPSLGTREVPQKCVPDRFSRFDIYIGYKSNKQTYRQAKNMYRL